MERVPLVPLDAKLDAVDVDSQEKLQAGVQRTRQRYACRLVSLLAVVALVILLIRGSPSFHGSQLRGGFSVAKVATLFAKLDEGEGELPYDNPDASNPFLYPSAEQQRKYHLPVLHRGYDCWQSCLGAGICSDFCGEGNACCRKGASNDPPECAKITDFWTNHHECVKPVVQVEVNHFAQDCWERCQIGGDCKWCGSGSSACCRKNSTLDPPECQGVVDWPTDRHHTCVRPVKDVEVKHEGQDCFEFCGGRGSCNWCGEGNACCKYGDHFDVSECRAVVYYSTLEHHVCVKPSFPKPLTMPALPRVDETDCAEGLVMDPVTRRCGLSHEPQRYTFYVYRLGNGSWTNANAGSLGAVLYTIHSKILGCPRQRGIDRIHRLKVTMKNTDKLFRKYGHQFGPLHHFRNGQCVSSFCNDTFREFGYTVGCSTTSSGQSSYPSRSHPAWYSLPGPCPNLPEGQKTEKCIADFAGGECSDPTGSHTCTYHIEDAGSVTLDELSGRDNSTSLKDWCAAGKVEYDPATDRGVGMHFWDQVNNGSVGKERMYKLAYLFYNKYPSFPRRLPEPCMRTH